MLLPKEAVFEILITFVNTFSIIERQRPAIISSGCFPFLCSVTMLLFIKTVHRLPKTAGFLELKAASAIFGAGILSEEAKFSRKEPQPEEQASFTTMFVIIPLSSHIAFMSCPPISSINEAFFMYFSAARQCATVSTT